MGERLSVPPWVADVLFTAWIVLVTILFFAQFLSELQTALAVIRRLLRLS